MEEPKYRVLLVDDDAGTIHVLHQLLSQEYDLRYALNGSAALDLAVSWQPHLVLLDAQMPGMTGTEVCQQLKTNPATAAIPVLFVTSLDHSGAELMAVELGAKGVVTKPPDAARLRAVLQEIFQPRTQPALPSADVHTDDGRPRVLIVDDDAAAVQTVYAALRELHAQFSFATSGEQCLALARQHRPDLILLDMYMPGLDGLSTLKALTADPALAETQVAIITRYAYPDMETRALEAGGVDFIAKPYTQAVLKARVRNLLRLREQKAQALAMQREQWQRIGNAKLARVVAAASDAIITADAAANVVLINAAACRMFGVDAALTIGRPLAALLPQLSLMSERAPTRQRLDIEVAPGRRIAAAVSVSRLAQDEEQLTTVVLHDLTEHERALATERARDDAEAALRTKTMMLSYIAHEVGNPLASIIGLTSLLRSGLEHQLEERPARLLKYMNESGQHLESLLRDVLDLQRIESGHFDLHPVAVDAAVAAGRALSAQVAQAEAAGVTLETVAPPQACPVWADETRLTQGLLNLVSNAVKYNRRGGRVCVRVVPTPTRVAFEVQDDGPGLDDQQQQQLFEPFNRLGRTDARGAGFGLALTRMLAVAMGGTLSVRSAAGSGSTFVLDLPAPPAPEP